MNNLEPNTILIPTPEVEAAPFEVPHRVVAVSPARSAISLFRLCPPTAAPRAWSLHDICSAVQAGLLQTGTQPLPPHLSHLSPKERERITHRMAVIRPIIESPISEWAYDSRKLFRIAERAAAAAGTSKKKVLRILYRFLQYGMSPAGLASDYALSGGRGKQRVAGTKKRGRPRNVVRTGHAADDAGVNVTQEVAQAFEIAYSLWVVNKRQYTIKTAYHLLLKRYYSSKSVNSATGEVHYHLLPNRPSYRQFLHWIRSQKDRLEIIRSRKGARFDLENRALRGHSQSDALFPGDIFQIDATLTNIYAASTISRCIPLGRPLLYFVADVYSTMIVGAYSGMGSPSWAAASVALYNAFRDKKAFCEEYGLQIRDEDWPCHHLPRRILADNGELRAHKPVNLIDGLGISIMLAPARRPDQKGLVEQLFNVIHGRSVEHLPGAVNDRLEDMRKRNYKLDATLTVPEIFSIMLNKILVYNNYTPVPHLLTDDMRRDGVEPTRRAIWEWGLRYADGAPRTIDPADARRHLLSSGRASVTERGIIFQNMRYACASEESEQWRARARNRGRWRVDVRYDPQNILTIYVVHPEKRELEPCTLIDTERHRSYRFDDIVDLAEYQKCQMAAIYKNQIEEEINAEERNRKIVLKAAKEKKSEALPPSVPAVALEERNANEGRLKPSPPVDSAILREDLSYQKGEHVDLLKNLAEKQSDRVTLNDRPEE